MAGPSPVTALLDENGQPIPMSVGQPEKVFDREQFDRDRYAQRSEAAMLAPPPAEPDRARYEQFMAGARNFDQSLRQARADHPALNWALDAPKAAGSALLGPIGWGTAGLTSAAFPGAKLPTATPDPGASEGAAAGTGAATAQASPGSPVPVSSLPDATTNVNALPSAVIPKPNFAGGVGGMAPGGGLGSDKALQGAQNDVIEGQQAQVEHATEGGNAKLSALEEGVVAQGKLAEAKRITAESEKKASEEITAEQAKYDDATAQARDQAAKMGIDPGRQFRDRGAAFNVMMAIGGAVSGMLSGLTGQPNAFVNTLRDITENDIKSQQTAIDQAWKNVGQMDTTYQNLVRRGIDKRLAANTYYGQVLDATETDLKARLMKSQIPVEKANIEASIQQIQNERSAMDVHKQEYWKAIYERRQAAAASAIATERERQWKHNMEFSELGIKKQNADTQRLEVEGKIAGKEDEGAKTFVPTGVDPTGQFVNGFRASSPEAAKEVQKAAKNHEALTKTIDEMKRLRGQGTFGAVNRAGSKNPMIVTPQWERAIDSEGANAIEKLNQGSGMGAYDKGTETLLKQRVGELKSVGPAGDQLLEQLQKQADREYNAYMNAYAGKPAQQVYGKDGKWHTVDAAPTGDNTRAPAGGGVGSVPGAKPFGQ